MGTTFKGRRVTRETVALGIGGQIERRDADLPPDAIVTFRAAAKVSSVRHKFLPRKKVEEQTVLTIIPASFEVLEVSEGVEEVELPFADQAGLDGDGDEEGE